MCCTLKVKKNYLLFLNILYFFIKNFGTNAFFQKENKLSLFWFYFQNCKIFVNPVMAKNNKLLLNSNPYKRIFNSNLILERKKFYLNKYEFVIDFVKKYNTKKFCEISSDYGFLIQKFEQNNISCIGLEPERDSFETSLKFSKSVHNKTFKEGLKHINSFNPEVISFSSCFRSIEVEALNYLNKLSNLKYIIVNEANELINHSKVGFKVLSINNFFYKFKSLNLDIDDIDRIMILRGFKLKSINVTYNDKNHNKQHLTSIVFQTKNV